MKMKRKFGGVLMAVLLLIVPTVGTEAKVSEVVVQPCYEYTKKIDAGLTISSEGVANVTSTCVSSSSNVEKIFLHVYLQKYVNEEWKNVQYWPASSQTRTCTLNKSTDLEHGYSYRVKVSAYVMTTDDSEQIVIYTGSKWY